jgi:hypothetical protein
MQKLRITDATRMQGGKEEGLDNRRKIILKRTMI